MIIIGCICGGVIETFLVVSGLSFIYKFGKKICLKLFKCKCECHPENPKEPKKEANGQN